jgi:nicotinate-nucleotide pyrophosphorylase (carboxylating)
MQRAMTREFQQTTWDDSLGRDWQAILRLAIAEDLGRDGDCTTRALIDEGVVGRAAVVARRPGVVAGLSGVEPTLAAIEDQLGDCPDFRSTKMGLSPCRARLRWLPQITDGLPVEQGTCAGIIDGPARGLLAAERILLNLLGRLSGIATLTRQYVAAIAGTKARIYDTRKTTPGWRRLEKYAVRCGGGSNHRSGLFDAVLIKDNHLALGARSAAGQLHYSPAEAVARARQCSNNMIVEVEVDTLEQLDNVLPASPDIVLLDNMSPSELSAAVARRNACNPAVELEASGGVNLESVRKIAEAGVDRISVGALTHSAIALDFGLDWLEG